MKKRIRFAEAVALQESPIASLVRSLGRVAWAAAPALLLALACPSLCTAQQPYFRSPIMSQPPDPFDSIGPVDPQQAAKNLRMQNAMRQKTMVSDTNKLLKLANELNAELSASPSGPLTRAQLRKVAEIEKLAHGVRTQMLAANLTPPPMQQLPINTYSGSSTNPNAGSPQGSNPQHSTVNH
jgi:hypothetical protein